MRACELDLLRANGAEPCLLMDTGGETGRISFSEAGLALRSNRRILINWDFRNPVNQRGLTEYTDPGYTIDMWKNDTSSVSITENGILITNNGSTISSCVQLIENILPINKKEICTISAICTPLKGTATLRLVRNSSPYGSVLDANLSTGLTFASGKEQYDYSGIYGVGVYLDPGSSCLLKAINLDPGPYQTLGHKEANGNWVLNNPQPDKALELLKCQRYLRVYGRDSGEGFIAFMSGINPDGSLKFQFNYPEMRANPTVINYNGLGTRSITDNADMAGSSYTFVADKTCMTIIDANSNFTSGKTYICGTSTHNGKIILSSEL